MSNLSWHSKSGELTTLASTDFGTEEELEGYLWANPELLGDLVIISRQTRTGSRHDIPDLIAVDTDGDVVVIELKKGAATEDIIPQVLRYAIWAETNPDSIRALWLECEDKPDEIEVDWDSFGIRIMIVAATIPARVLRLVNRIAYPTDLVEISRFQGDSGQFVLVTPRTPEPVANSGPAKGQRVWDEKWYREGHNSASVDEFLAVVGRIEDLARERDWQLEPKMNKNYVGFKYGFFNAFGVQWLGSKSFGIFFKLPEAVADSFDLSDIEEVRYVELWKQLECRIVGKDYPLEKLMPAFEAAYKQVAGK